MSDKSNSISLLEDFLIDNRELDELENRIAEFNIFEAIGSVRHELRHSDFLAFLLNPSEKHKLDEIFLKRFLIDVISSADDAPISPLTIKLTDLSHSIVERESQNIDILIHDDKSGIVCAIENKIFSSEHSNQLARYLQVVKTRFPSATAIIPVFLTPDGSPPEDENSPYIAYSYGQVADILEKAYQAHITVLGPDINTLINHYVMMLRRHIVSDSDIARLCQEIYKTHKEAIDLIVEHMPDQRQELSSYLVNLVSSVPYFVIIRNTKAYIDFVLDEWQKIPEFNKGIGWPNSIATLALEFSNSENGLTLYLELGPVDQNNQHIREAIFGHANKNTHIFKGCRPRLSKQWSVLYKLQILRSRDYQNTTIEDLHQIIDEKWNRFLDHVLPQLHEQLMMIDFS